MSRECRFLFLLSPSFSPFAHALYLRDSRRIYVTRSLGPFVSVFYPRSEARSPLRRDRIFTREQTPYLFPCVLADGAALRLRRGKIFRGGHVVLCIPWKPTLVLIGNVTGRNAHIASAGGVYAGSHYLKCTAAVSHTGPPAGQKQNSEARYYSRSVLARSFVRSLVRSREHTCGMLIHNKKLRTSAPARV